MTICELIDTLEIGTSVIICINDKTAYAFRAYINDDFNMNYWNTENYKTIKHKDNSITINIVVKLEKS